jgi:DNA-binding helix-hairpin-helix protein with protein kinase domain
MIVSPASTLTGADLYSERPHPQKFEKPIIASKFSPFSHPHNKNLRTPPLAPPLSIDPSAVAKLKLLCAS